MHHVCLNPSVISSDFITPNEYLAVEIWMNWNDPCMHIFNLNAFSLMSCYSETNLHVHLYLSTKMYAHVNASVFGTPKVVMVQSNDGLTYLPLVRLPQ